MLFSLLPKTMHTSFAGKRIIVGVTGSIAAFKVAGWVSTLAQEEAEVDVVMTESAKRFVTSLTFSSLSGRRVLTNMFSAEEEGTISHIGLSREADCIIVAPATAQTIARLTYGFADDLLTTTILAADIPVLICPAMNVKMFEHPATQRNIEIAKALGYKVIEPECGNMACGDYGKGRLPEWNQVSEYLLKELSDGDLKGQNVLVTAGPTRESYDPARFISNRSSGKMGFAIARAAFRRGAEVTLITGPTSLDWPAGVRVIPVVSAQQMYDAVMSEFSNASVIIKAAAVSDFKSAEDHSEKIKKDNATLTIKLVPNPDILQALGARCDSKKQLLVGFAAESSDLEEQGRKKLERKNLALIAVNNIASAQGGFEVDSNQLVLIDHNGVTELPHTSKIKAADMLWDHIVKNNLLRT